MLRGELSKWSARVGCVFVAAVMLASFAAPTSGAVVQSSSASEIDTRSKSKKPSKPKWNPRLLVPKLSEVRRSGPPLSRIGCHAGQLVTNAAPCEFGSENKRRVLLFGDSHAAHLFGPFNRVRRTADKFQLVTLTKAACAAVDYSRPVAPAPVVPIPGEMVAPDKAKNCQTWRQDALEKLSRQEFGKFDLVVLSPIVPGEKSPKSRFKGWKAGYLRTLSILAKSAPKILILRDMPHLPKSKDVVRCITKYKAKAERKCGAPARRALNPKAWRITRQVAARFNNVGVVDLASATCEKKFCSPLQGRYIKVRDAHHYVHSYMTRKLYLPLQKQILKRV